MTLREMKKRRREVHKRFREIVKRAKDEKRDVTDSEDSELARLSDESDQLAEKIERAEERAASEWRSIDPPAPDPDDDPVGLERREVPRGERFKYAADPAYSTLRVFAGQPGPVERRASDELVERDGREIERGHIRVPVWQLLSREERTGVMKRMGYEERDITKATTGAAMVGTDLMGASWVEVIRNSSIAVMAGAQVLDSLVGDVDIPRQVAAGAVQWLASETADLTPDTTFDTDALQLRPKTAGLRHDMSRRMLKQSTPGIQEIANRDIRAAIGVEVDAQALAGDGTGGTPTGIVNVSGVGAVDITGGASWADILEFETDLGEALRGRLAYAVRHATAGTLKSTKKDDGSGLFLMEGNEMNGYPALRSNNVPAAAPIIFGNWAELVLGVWGSGIDLFADPYTLGDRGGVVVRGFMDMDVQLRHEASFSVGTGA